MRRLAALSAILLLSASSAWGQNNPLVPPGPAPIRPVTETLWGKSVTDNYRYMEAMGPETQAWMKAEGGYTRAVLDSIKPLAALQARVERFTASFGLIQHYQMFGGRAFYEERAPGSDNFDLVVKDTNGTRKLVDVAALRAAHGGAPYAINWFLPSPDGAKVAVGVSAGGSEDASVTVYDAATGAAIAGPIDRAQFGATAWTDDGKTVFFNRLKELAAGDPPTERYKDSTLDAWDLKSDPVPLLGTTVGHGPTFAAAEFPTLSLSPGGALAAAVSINGVQNEFAVWTTPTTQAANPQAQWTKLVVRDDGVTGADMRGGDIFLKSHKNAPTFQVLELNAGEPLRAARVLLPARPDRVVEDIHAASDALYVLARHGAYSELLRVPAGTKNVEEVSLPYEGHIAEAFADPRVSGITIEESSWITPPAEYSYNPATKRFTKLDIGTHGDIDAADYRVSDLEAPAKDGVNIPLSLIQRKDAKGPQITLIEAYGSYGISQLADFSTRRAAAMREGITYGVCHVRGGGELGEAWRLAGKDDNKHNTWEDVIACGRYALAHGIAEKGKLFIIGGSAGGITMGRALTEAPALFAGVLDMVPAGNPLRMEFTPNGPPNIPEFGTIKTEQGFKNLYAMDTTQHVERGAQYPAVMVTTGLNDPRVSSWEPAKVAASLQASGSSKPVLLRIDAEAGHGIGSTKTQTDLLSADSIAFIFWQAGMPEWQPQALGQRPSPTTPAAAP